MARHVMHTIQVITKKCCYAYYTSSMGYVQPSYDVERHCEWYSMDSPNWRDDPDLDYARKKLLIVLYVLFLL